MFNSTQNQYLKLRGKEGNADTWLKDIVNWIFKSKHLEVTTNQLKVDHLTVQKIPSFIPIQKIQGVSKPGELNKRQNLLNLKQI